jgi:cytochrome c peroxidase
MALTNVAYGVSFFRDGGVPSLELQVVAPIVAENEMNETIDNVVNKLLTHQYYSKTFRSVFGEDVSLSSITKAIASFERTLISGNSDYDKQFYQGQNVMSERALRGKALFFSERLNCTKCHSGFNFSNNLFENNGLYEVYQDPGRRRVTVRVQDDGKFKVPSLRNVELTAPYMHDGSLKTLEDVIEHYNSGGSNHPQKSKFITPLNLSSQEKEDLASFLKSLSDKEFITNQNFSHP